MLTTLHSTIKHLLYEQGHMPEEVDIQFEMPKRDWIDSLLRPTINFFLCEIQENVGLRQAAPQTERGNGTATKRLPPRRFDLRYLVSAFSSVTADEHLLLWRTLGVLLKYDSFPPELLDDALRGLEPSLVTKISQPDQGPRPLELWGGLELPPRPALIYTVTAPLDLKPGFEVPLVLTATTRFSRRSPAAEAEGTGIDPADAVPVASGIHIGGLVRNRQGTPLAGARVSVVGSAAEPVATNAAGRFVLSGLQAGVIRLRILYAGKTMEVEKTVPAQTYEFEIED